MKKKVAVAAEATAAYIPVDTDFKWKENAGDISIDENFVAQNFWHDVFVRFFRKTSAVIGLLLIILITVFAIIGPGMNDFGYSDQYLSQKNFAPRVKALEKFGIFDGTETMKTTTGKTQVNYYQEKDMNDLYYWFGSDNFGRDIWTRTWSGARVSLIIAVAAALIDMIIGMSYGLISGYFGGKTDMLMQRFLEVANGIPRLVIVTLLLLVLKPGMLTIIFALMLTEWVGMSRIARAEMLKLKEQDILAKVGLAPEHASRYPHQFSGGQRQRVGIARALIMNPKLIIADECISALDVSIQAQVVNLMKDIQQETGTAYLFIAHDLSMVKYISDRIGVLHLGHLLETGTTEEIFSNPIHPYTRSLLSAIPAPNPIVEKQRVAESYDYKTSGIDYNQGTDHLVSGSHYVKCTDEEFAKWTAF